MFQALQQLRALNTERIDIDDAVALLTFGSAMKATYGQHDMEPPQWLADAVDILHKEVNAKRRAELDRRLREAKARKEALRTKDELRAANDAEIERLEKALAQ